MFGNKIVIVGLITIEYNQKVTIKVMLTKVGFIIQNLVYSSLRFRFITNSCSTRKKMGQHQMIGKKIFFIENVLQTK